MNGSHGKSLVSWNLRDPNGEPEALNYSLVDGPARIIEGEDYLTNNIYLYIPIYIYTYTYIIYIYICSFFLCVHIYTLTHIYIYISTGLSAQESVPQGLGGKLR